MKWLKIKLAANWSWHKNVDQDSININSNLHFSEKHFTRGHCLDLSHLTLEAPIPQNGQTHTNNSSANYRRIVWVCLTILWNWLNTEQSIWKKKYRLTLLVPIPEKERKLISIFIFTILYGASKGFLKALKSLIKPFVAPQRNLKI